jgi:1-acyl-sn-glycerol-3-phosphate acyltransferase
MTVLPVPPPSAPHIRNNLWRRIFSWAADLAGWKLVGQMPDVPKLILIGAPHSSYWDGLWGVLLKVQTGIDIGVMIKQEVIDGPLGLILRPLGAVPINRKAATGVVEQMIERFDSREKMWLGITPEGTRKKVTQWKSGFLRIAQATGVPIQPLFIDYPTRTFTLGPLIHASDDPDADMARIREMFRPYRGKHRNTD